MKKSLKILFGLVLVSGSFSILYADKETSADNAGQHNAVNGSANHDDEFLQNMARATGINTNRKITGYEYNGTQYANEQDAQKAIDQDIDAYGTQMAEKSERVRYSLWYACFRISTIVEFTKVKYYNDLKEGAVDKLQIYAQDSDEYPYAKEIVSELQELGILFKRDDGKLDVNIENFEKNEAVFDKDNTTKLAKFLAERSKEAGEFRKKLIAVKENDETYRNRLREEVVRGLENLKQLSETQKEELQKKQQELLEQQKLVREKMQCIQTQNEELNNAKQEITNANISNEEKSKIIKELNELQESTKNELAAVQKELDEFKTLNTKLIEENEKLKQDNNIKESDRMIAESFRDAFEIQNAKLAKENDALKTSLAMVESFRELAEKQNSQLRNEKDTLETDLAVSESFRELAEKQNVKLGKEVKKLKDQTQGIMEIHLKKDKISKLILKKTRKNTISINELQNITKVLKDNVKPGVINDLYTMDIHPTRDNVTYLLFIEGENYPIQVK